MKDEKVWRALRREMMRVVYDDIRRAVQRDQRTARLEAAPP
jgi:hypothetical protein